MPLRPLRACASTTRCPALVRPPVRYCPAHAQERDVRIDAGRGSAAQRGYGSRWRRLRAYLLTIEPVCRACAQQGITRAATDVDHIKPKALGGEDVLSNLQPMCHACHSAKTMRESVAPHRRTA